MPDPFPGDRPTLEAVAAYAGVSRATVSRVVNGSTGVRESLVEKVRRAVEELGYVPNHAARTLVTRRTGAVAVIIAEPEDRIFSDPFFSLQIRGISKELTAHDTQLVLLLVEGGDYDRIARYLAGGHVDGALAFSLHTDDPVPAIARRTGVPTVYGGRPLWTVAPDDQAVPYVDADNRGGARAAVRHLRDLGRRRIAHIAGPPDQTSATDRLDGYRDVLAGGDPALVAQGAFTAESGALAMAELLDRCPDLDAVFAANDLMASGALRVLKERGRTVPGDVALVGFDNMDSVAETTEPPLTTVQQDVEGQGRLMARLLLRRLGRDDGGDDAAPDGHDNHSHRDARDGGNAPDQGSVIMPTTLVRRASA
ncbi:LacI family transcriptional regulator [Streptomyces sp. 150FB]|uniref:LacI family DNA-binding transcriptional regulator n=1 Tax=Streptomyces sp. 150FB TaxID=1576605 RepID=UPI0005894F6B|nr:LacI family DNA-binding transcriptional regulator [Streptomyces sp. 150FB]KIF77778.1 LacI family transcriptional regulator [Streptomyces sp. 150FB]